MNEGEFVVKLATFIGGFRGRDPSLSDLWARTNKGRQFSVCYRWSNEQDRMWRGKQAWYDLRKALIEENVCMPFDWCSFY